MIRVTIWGTMAQSEEYGWERQPIVAFRSARVGKFNVLVVV